MAEIVGLEAAIERHVRPGDTINVIMGHSRWTALVRELARQHWHASSDFTLVMASLSSLGTLLFRAGCLKKVITAYSGDSFPTYTPNPVYQRAYAAGEVEVEHWSFASYVQRLQAAADGLPAAVTGSLRGSSMTANDDYAEVETDFGPVALVAPLVPDVAFVHGAVADRTGNVALAPPLLEGVAGVYAAKRGVIASVEAVVDDLRPWAGMTRIPAHRVLAVVEAPFGAHPGGLYVGTPGQPGGLPVEAYGEDIAFWIEARDATRRDDLDVWIKQWCLDLESHEEYLAKLGDDRLDRLRQRSHPMSWRADDDDYPVDVVADITPAERAAVWAASVLAERIAERSADAVLAGAGLANLAAWVGVDQARKAGSDVSLTAELGMWDYTPTPADPFIFNFRSFPSASMLSDSPHVLDTLIGGPGTTSIACVGTAQFDRHGNLNSTELPEGRFLVGSGGGNDVVTRADEVLVVSLLSPRSSVQQCSYITGPGDRVHAVVTDRGVLTRLDGELVLTAVAPGSESIHDRVRDAREHCGWDLNVAQDVTELPAVRLEHVLPLRNFDRHGWFLGR